MTYTEIQRLCWRRQTRSSFGMLLISSDRLAMRHSKVADIEVPDPPLICIRQWHVSLVITLEIKFYRDWCAEAIRLYTEAIAGASADAELFANRSIAYLAAGSRQEALDDACQATRLRPEWAKAQYRCMYAHAQGSCMQEPATQSDAEVITAFLSSEMQ